MGDKVSILDRVLPIPARERVLKVGIVLNDKGIVRMPE